jgi:hypothetical protein
VENLKVAGNEARNMFVNVAVKKIFGAVKGTQVASVFPWSGSEGLQGSVVGVLGRTFESYSAKPAQLSSHTGPPAGHGSSMCRLAGLYGCSAELAARSFSPQRKVVTQ